MNLASEVAETINGHPYGYDAEPNLTDSQSTQYVDVDGEPFGSVFEDILSEHSAVVVRVDSNINGAFDGDGTRYWFARIYPESYTTDR